MAQTNGADLPNDFKFEEEVAEEARSNLNLHYLNNSEGAVPEQADASVIEKIFMSDLDTHSYFLSIIVWSIVILNENILHFQLKTYEGDIYNNTLILVGSGFIAVSLGYTLIKFMHPAVALSVSFILTAVPGIFYPYIHSQKILFPDN